VTTAVENLSLKFSLRSNYKGAVAERATKTRARDFPFPPLPDGHGSVATSGVQCYDVGRQAIERDIGRERANGAGAMSGARAMFGATRHYWGEEKSTEAPSFFNSVLPRLASRFDPSEKSRRTQPFILQVSLPCV